MRKDSPLLQTRLIRNQAPQFIFWTFPIEKRYIKLPRTIIQAHGRIDILINCAGVAVLETIEDIGYEYFEWVMACQFLGRCLHNQGLSPIPQTKYEAHIVNLSSVDGIVPNPNNGAYASAKAALRCFTETLFQELQGTNVSVTSVIPWWSEDKFAPKCSILQKSRARE